jgi:hypothetical protein
MQVARQGTGQLTMPGLITHDKIIKALFKPGAKPRLATVEKALRRRGLPFGYGEGVLFTTEAAWNAKIMGVESDKKDDETIEFLRE